MTIPIAIVGGGKIARDQHVPAIAALGDFILVAAVTTERSPLPGVPNFRTIPDMMAQMPAVKAVALFGPERSPLLPEIPTTKELGLPDVVMENWYGIFLPAGTPKDVADKLEKALFKVVELPAVKERFAANGMHDTLGSAAFKARLAKEFPYWQDTIKKLGIAGE